MCGICAIINKNHFIQILSESFNRLKHRGPDSTTFRQIKNIYLGFHRLAIIDPEERSNQPLVHNDVYLICNGEIYNYKDLIKQYDLHCNSGSDCEVIIHLYEKFGIDNTCKLLDAEFSFVLYDAKNNMIFVARDRFGVRPLFMNCNVDYIMIASEAKGIPNNKINSTYPFPPAHYVVINPISLSCRFIKYRKVAAPFSIQPPNIHETILKLFVEAVKKRLMSDRPLGCLLSGGVDSSLVTSIASRYIKDLHCFSVGLDNESIDIIAAKKVVKFLGLKNHHIITFTVQEGFEVLEEVINTLESYDVTTIRASVPQYLMSKYISQKTDIKVILSGEGSDELFAGYRYNRNAPSAHALYADGLRLLEELYMFDNLRTDRTTAKWGLEVRVPFLDNAFIDYVLSTDATLRLHTGTMEKLLLRDSFKDGYLPDDILYRPKEAFSDAVSTKDVSWYKSLQNIIDKELSDDEFNREKITYQHNPPMTKEALYYRRIFNKYFPEGDHFINHYWFPKWVDKDLVDPSATALKCY
jgi:asparagine synthase (glutamine-hydrolysing)